jgi:hypothetical protein
MKRTDLRSLLARPPRKVPLAPALRLASCLLAVVLCLGALQPALRLLESGNRTIGIVWLASGVTLAGVVIAINERIVAAVHTKTRGGIRLAQAYLWVKGAIGIAAGFKFEGVASALGWALVATVLSAWALFQWVRARMPE